MKIGDLKLFECPQSLVSGASWKTLALINECTDEHGSILHLPYAGTLLEQPTWFRQAAKIVREERARDFKETRPGKNK